MRKLSLVVEEPLVDDFPVLPLPHCNLVERIALAVLHGHVHPPLAKTRVPGQRAGQRCSPVTANAIPHPSDYFLEDARDLIRPPVHKGLQRSGDQPYTCGPQMAAHPAMRRCHPASPGQCQSISATSRQQPPGAQSRAAPNTRSESNERHAAPSRTPRPMPRCATIGSSPVD